MEISIRLTTVAPPAGTVHPVHPGVAGGDEPGPPAVEFVGWLGLLRALSEVIGEPGAARSTGATPTGGT